VNLVQEGDLALLIGKDGKRYLVRMQAGGQYHTHRGIIKHDDLIGQPWGREVLSHLLLPFFVLKPSINDVLMNTKRIGQIIYPKEIGYLLLKMNIGNGAQVVEAGTGSGALTTALAFAVRPEGRVYSYEAREDMLRAAEKNLRNAGLRDYVELKCRDIAQGFDEREADALFLDVRTPWYYLGQAREALASGGFFGALLPTTNQVAKLVAGLEIYRFMDIEVLELLMRPYKPVAQRLRPADRMIAHTGFLIFARQTTRPLPEQIPDINLLVATDQDEERVEAEPEPEDNRPLPLP
jgi:tRNA (adenine57-N1/adenine58-N1)-methyltransferase